MGSSCSCTRPAAANQRRDSDSPHGISRRPLYSVATYFRKSDALRIDQRYAHALKLKPSRQIARRQSISNLKQLPNMRERRQPHRRITIDTCHYQ
jgi:hypothetical protein